MQRDTAFAHAPLWVAAALLPLALAGAGGALNLELAPPQRLALHALLELAAIVLAVQIVTMAWHSLDVPGYAIARALIFGFTLSALLGVVHTVNYGGMPDLPTPADPRVGQSLAAMARALEALALLLAAWRAPLRGQRWQWLLAAGLLFPVLYLVATTAAAAQLLQHPGWGAGVGLALAVAAGRFVVRARLAGTVRLQWATVGCLTLALAAWLPGLSPAGGDDVALAAHLLRGLGLLLACATVSSAALREPHQRLAASEQLVRDQQRQLQTLLNHVPAGVARVDRQLKLLYCNDIQARRMGCDAAELTGRPLEMLLDDYNRPRVLPALQRCLEGEVCVVEGRALRDRDDSTYSRITLIPERDEHGTVTSVVSFGIDISQQVKAEQALTLRLREVSELTQALDEHAIVAVTDRHGVITRVNDRFCAISQYRREELLGRTHHLVNSGHHDPAFFRAMWHTISAGSVWQGDICNRAKDGSLYWVQTTIVPQLDSDGFVRQYVAIRTDITARQRAEAEIRALALYDPLTNLPNRRLLLERIEHTRQVTSRTGQYAALLLMDLDHFKAINDQHGHDHGDVVLRGISQRLLACPRQSDTPARLGGDEFVVLLQNLGDDLVHATGVAAEMAEMLRVELGQGHDHGGLTLVCSPSMGVTLFSGATFGVDDLLKQADVALYQAKTLGRDRVQFFDPRSQAVVAQRASATGPSEPLP